MADSDPPPEDDEPNYFDAEGEPIEAASPMLAVIDGGLTPSALDIELCALPPNDLGNAERLERRNPDQLWWTSEWGPGVWDGRRFDFDHGEARAGIAAQECARRMLTHEIAAFYQTQKSRKEKAKDFEQRAGKFYGWCLRAGDNAKTKAMLEQCERRRTRPLGDFDPNPQRLAVANGTLELPQDGSPARFVEGHDPAHLNTRVATAKYDPRARAPEFDKFLERVQPEPEMRAFLARIVGYCLTAHIEEQAYFIFQGKGGDGKSTFLTAIEAALGGYVANAAIDSFLKHERKGSDHSADLARLASGPRLVKAAEPEQGARFAEAMLKSVTGGEPIVARAMFLPPFEFLPNWKLIVSCNRKPQIRGDDRGIWRRTLVAPWPVSLPKDEMDRRLAEKLAAERDGILQWALRGWADWVERGLDPPETVLKAVEEYRLQSNPFGVWFDTCCDFGEAEREASDRLYKSYKGWVGDAGFEPMTRTAFGRGLSDRNLDRKHSNGIVWLGVKLNVAGEDAMRMFELQEEDRLYPNASKRGGARVEEDG
jgi:putative DNA primase/helicase